ncbi:MAG: exo-alpha-sialidase [Promethearchaeota archaeon]
MVSCNSTKGEIWASKSEYPYEFWETTIRITDNPAIDKNPSCLVDSNGVMWIFWHSNRLNSNDIWYKNSSDDGKTWSQAYALTNTSFDEKYAQVITDSNSIWVFYTTNSQGTTDIAFQKSENSGRSWQQEQIIALSNNSIGEELCDAYINQDGMIILLIQEQVSSYSSVIWSSKDNGENWVYSKVTPPKINENNLEGTVFVSAQDKTVNVIYQRNFVFYIRSSKIGNLDWSDENFLTSDDHMSLFPDSFVNENDTLYIVWSSDQDGDLEIYLKIFHNQDVNRNIGIFELFESVVPLSIGIMIITSVFLIGSIFLHRSHGENKVSIPVDKTLGYSITTFFSLLIGQILYPPRLRKLSASEIQTNDTRAIILQLLEENDFLHFREIKRRIPTGTALLRWHLQVLEDFGFIRQKRHGQYLIYYLREKKPHEHYLVVYFASRSDIAAKILSLFAKVDTWTISGLTERLDESRKKLLYHCDKLIEYKILQRDNDKPNYLTINSIYISWINLVLLERN